MRAVVDNSVLLYLIHPEAPAPVDTATGKPVDHCAERVEGLLDDLEKDGIEVVVPAPVLSELMIKAVGRENDILAALQNKRAVRIASFDTMAAIENAMLRRSKSARNGATKKEVSFDLQILAIARATGSTLILTDDANLRHRAIAAGMSVMGIADLKIPDARRQRGLPFDQLGEPSDCSADLGSAGEPAGSDRLEGGEEPRNSGFSQEATPQSGDIRPRPDHAGVVAGYLDPGPVP